MLSSSTSNNSFLPIFQISTDSNIDYYNCIVRPNKETPDARAPELDHRYILKYIYMYVLTDIFRSCYTQARAEIVRSNTVLVRLGITCNKLTAIKAL